jgi:hypothetical protein
LITLSCAIVRPSRELDFDGIVFDGLRRIFVSIGTQWLTESEIFQGHLFTTGKYQENRPNDRHNSVQHSRRKFVCFIDQNQPSTWLTGFWRGTTGAKMRTSRWPPQLLLPRGGVISVFGHYGIENPARCIIVLIAIPSSSIVRLRRHPSRLPFGSLRSAWTGPGAFAENISNMREWRNQDCRSYRRVREAK